MFSHILVPLDGSQLAEKAFRAAVVFAKQAGARVTGYYAAQPTPKPVSGEGYFMPSGRYDPNAGSQFMKRLARRAGVYR